MTPDFSTFVLCAGFGERLKPVTRHRPKPLLPAGDGTILGNILRRLTDAGCRNFVLNTHHLPEAFEQFACSTGQLVSSSGSRADYLFHHGSGTSELVIVREQEILGTGGGIANLYHSVKPEKTVLIHNGDVSCLFDPRSLLEAHRLSGCSVTLLLLGNGPADCIEAFTDGRVSSIYGNPRFSGNKLMTYTGIAAMEPRFLASIPLHRNHLVPSLIRRLEEDPGSIGWVEAPTGSWEDLGTVEKYISNLGFEYGPTERKSAPGGERKPGGILINEAKKNISSKALVRDVVLLDGGEISAADVYYGGIIAPGCSLEPDQFHTPTPEKPGEDVKDHIRRLDAPKKLLGSGWSEKVEIENLAGAGSQRIYFRIKTASDERFILMDCRGNDLLLQQFLAVHGAMESEGLAPPDLLAFSMKDTTVVLEDLGNDSLLNQFRNCSADREIVSLYKPVVEYLAGFQAGMHRRMSLLPARGILRRKFNHWLFTWESRYFLKYFLREYCRASSSDSTDQRLNKELADIAGKSASLPQLWCHRDFQSTNILLKDGNIRIIDFQDGRSGPPVYDLASLLRDAYVRIGKSAESELLEIYCAELKKKAGWVIESTDFKKEYRLVSISRGMQALGAFAKLSLVDGKFSFEAHIPRGLTRLRQVLTPDGDYPALASLVWSLDPLERMEERRTLTLSKKWEYNTIHP